MKNIFIAALAALLLAGTGAGAQAGTPAKAPAKAPAQPSQHKINLLVVTGGHKFDSTEFFAMFDNMKDLTYTHMRQPEVQKILNPKDSRPYDVILFYDMWKDLDQQHRQDLIDMVRGGRSVLFLHHSIASYDPWPEWLELVGAKYVRSSFTSVDGVSYSPSSYRHDVPQTMEVMKNNPVFSPRPAFGLIDEVQNCIYSLSPSIPLLMASFEDRAMPAAWLRTYGKGTVITFKPGHDKQVFNDPNYQQLLHEAIVYLAKKNKR